MKLNSCSKSNLRNICQILRIKIPKQDIINKYDYIILINNKMNSTPKIIKKIYPHLNYNYDLSVIDKYDKEFLEKLKKLSRKDLIKLHKDTNISFLKYIHRLDKKTILHSIYNACKDQYKNNKG